MRRKANSYSNPHLNILPSAHNQKSEVLNAKLPITNVSCFLFSARSGGGQAGQSLSMVLLRHARFLKPTPELSELRIWEHDFAVLEPSNWEALQIFVRRCDI